MKPEEFKTAREALGYTRKRVAQLFDIASVTTVQNWEIGKGEVPGCIAAVMQFMVEQPLWRPWFEARRPPPEPKKRGRPRKLTYQRTAEETVSP